MIKDLSPIDAGRWFRAAPPLVQDTVTSPATQQALELIGKQFSLHIDILDVVVKITNYMLLGYVNPEQALQELRGAGVTDQQARQILDEINKKIFVPLRDKMRIASSPAVQAPASTLTKSVVPPSRRVVPPVVGTPPPGPQRPVPPPAPTAAPVSSPRPQPMAPVAKPIVPPPPPPPFPKSEPATYFHLENKLRTQEAPKSPAGQPVRPAVATPLPAQVRPVPVQPMTKAAAPQSLASIISAATKTPVPPPMRPVSNIAPLPPRMVLPGINHAPITSTTTSRPVAAVRPQVAQRPSLTVPPAPQPAAPVAPPPMPAKMIEMPKQQMPAAPSIARTITPPTNLPGAMPPITLIQKPMPAPAAPVKPTAQPAAPYPADPYREPIE